MCGFFCVYSHRIIFPSGTCSRHATMICPALQVSGPENDPSAKRFAMSQRSTVLSKIYAFLPVRLFLETLRNNYSLLLIWLMLFLFIARLLGYRYGMHSLFLAPEYLGRVDPLSFLVLGFTTGIFIMSFHMSSYITLSYQFPVIATFRRPFLRFSLNNLLIPVSFLFVYLGTSMHYQVVDQMIPVWKVVGNLFSYVAGIGLFYLVTFGYFNVMNRSLENLFSLSQGKMGQWKIARPLKRIAEKDLRWKTENAPQESTGSTGIRYYLDTPFRIRSTPRRLPYPVEAAQSILNRNRTFALVFIFFLFLTLVLTGIYINRPVFAIPAAASIMLIFSMSLFLYDLFYIMFKDYAFWFFLAFLILIYFMMSSGIVVQREGWVYGLKYGGLPQSKEIRLDPMPGQAEQDKRETLAVLERWKKNMRQMGEEKPPLVVINSCGGGLKAALWSYYAIAYADSLLGHRLMPHVRLMTGASGGMVGAAYLRELWLRKGEGYAGADSVTQRFQDLSQDMLNPIVLFLALKDWSIGLQRVEYNGEIYRRDRGWALEHKLNKNTGFILDKPLIAYRKPEIEARIPMMFLTPTSLNDGRQMLISPLHTAYMCGEINVARFPSMVEYLRAYHPYGSEQTLFTSALRMNATYPVISPLVKLPGEPQVTVMDAGFRDNFGYLAAVRFLYVFRDWINKNTGGVVIISMGIDKNFRSAAGKFFDPFRNLYSDFFNIQMLNGQEMISNMQPLFPVGLEVLRLDLNERNKKISLSWQLTPQEKEHIRASIYSEDNQHTLQRLRELIR